MARSTLGVVRAGSLAAELAGVAAEASAGESWRRDPALARRLLEDTLFEQALAAEASGDPAAQGAARAARDEALVQAFEERLYRGLPEPNEEQIAAFLQANAALVQTGERLRLRHVFRRLPARASAEERQRARAELDQLRREVLAGADFGALARERSDSETAKFDGLITPVGRGGLPAPIEQVVWKLAVGELSDVVDTPVGLHVFRLEERLPASELTAEQKRAWARQRLVNEARQAARLAAFERLKTEGGASYAPPSSGTRAVPATPVFRLGDTSVSVADLERARAELSFAERHRTTLAELAERQAWRRLVAWDADRTALAREPDVAFALERARRRTLAQHASAKRLQAWAEARPDDELRARFDSAPERYGIPEQLRLSVIVQQIRPGASPNAPFEALSALARELRLGPRDLAATAREVSDDASAAAGGDLGQVSLRELQEWAGQQTAERIARLAPGELGGPFLLDVYREEQLGTKVEGALLARVEERTPALPRTFAEARAQVAEALARDQPLEARAAVRADVLASIQAQVFEPALKRALERALASP